MTKVDFSERSDHISEHTLSTDGTEYYTITEIYSKLLASSNGRCFTFSMCSTTVYCTQP